MERRFSNEELYLIRNIIPVRLVIADILCIPAKEVEGVFRFVCPCCNESQTAVNPGTNLSRCFLCQKNFNTIEIVMADQRVGFVEAVKTLRSHLPAQPAAAMLKSVATSAGVRQ